MIKEFTPETVLSVMGGVQYSGGLTAERTPLHIDFTRDTHLVHGEYIDTEQQQYSDEFNAIGSVAIDLNGKLLGHLPVIDVDGGVTVRNYGNISKAILIASYNGNYRPASDLRDVLGDHGVDLEVYQSPVMEQVRMGGNIVRNIVSAIVLRSKDVVFEAVESTIPNHGHLYIQKLFSPLDHVIFVEELREIGIISAEWLDIIKLEGMGIVRTPWTKKDPSHMGS